MYTERYPKIFPLDWSLTADAPGAERPNTLKAAEAIERFFSAIAPPEKPAALYVHIPFCKQNCAFCCFSRVRVNDYEPVTRYLQALKREIELWADSPWAAGLKFESVFFGGGTPSVLRAEDIDDLMQTLKSSFTLNPDVEISFEGSPFTLDDEEKLGVLKAHGCTRISMGIQSFDGPTRRNLGLPGDREDLTRILDRIRNFHPWDVSIDLLYGYPGQSRSVLEADVRHAIDLGLVNLDCYDMMNSPLDRLFWAEHLGETPPRPDMMSRYDLTRMVFDLLEGAGYRVDNFMSEFYREGHRCRYKEAMFSEVHELLALGTSGAGNVGNARLIKEDHIGDYVKDVEAGKLPAVLLTEPPDLPGWKIMHGLVLLRIDPARLEQSLGYDPLDRYQSKIDELTAKGLLAHENGKYAATRLGKLWLENVALEFAQPHFGSMIREQMKQFESVKKQYPSAGVTSEELWKRARKDMGVPVELTFSPGAEEEMIPLREVQAYIDIKMTRSLSYLVELFKELRQAIPEEQLDGMVRRATNASIPAAKKVMEKTSHLFMKYIRSGRWPEFMKDEQFSIEERDGKVFLTIPKCVLRPYRLKEPFICLNEHEFVRELLYHYRGLDVEDDYVVEQTWDQKSGDHACRLCYALKPKTEASNH